MIPIEEQVAYHNEGQPLMTHRLDEPLHIKRPSRIGVQFMGDLFHNTVSHRHVLGVLSVIAKCPQHTFFILTKRVFNMSDFFTFYHKDLGLDILQNLWLGVTICNQPEADEKIPALLRTPAAHRWVSYEPVLGPIDFRESVTVFDNTLDWVVAGAETGPGARPAENDWFRRVRDDCKAAGVPYFQKATTGPTPDDLQIREYPKGELWE